MILIREIVQQAITNSYLTVEAEEQLRRLLRTKYEKEDLNAFMKLQQAAMEGHVTQESCARLA
jgi:flagellar biosynthesis protein FliP